MLRSFRTQALTFWCRDISHLTIQHAPQSCRCSPCRGPFVRFLFPTRRDGVNGCSSPPICGLCRGELLWDSTPTVKQLQRQSPGLSQIYHEERHSAEFSIDERMDLVKISTAVDATRRCEDMALGPAFCVCTRTRSAVCPSRTSPCPWRKVELRSPNLVLRSSNVNRNGERHRAVSDPALLGVRQHRLACAQTLSPCSARLPWATSAT